MIFRFAAVCALALELLLFFHLISLPLLHAAPPFTGTAVCFVVTFIVSETWEIAVHTAQAECDQQIRWCADQVLRWSNDDRGRQPWWYWPWLALIRTVRPRRVVVRQAG